MKAISFRRVVLAGALLGVLFTADSCSYKRLTYLQDMETLTTYDVTEAPEVRVRKNDKIKILVSSTNPVLAAPFNLVSGSADVDIATGKVETGNASAGVEYTVDKNGEILFPILGNIKVEGLTLSQVKEEISRQITAKNYIKDPIITAEYTNFQITILGEVNGKGNYVVKDNKMNVLQAIAMAGDLTSSAQTDNVWVIRTEGKEREVYPIDLRSKSCFDSPGFYLQQDDIVYVKPRKTKLDANAQLGLQISSIALSAMSTAATVLYFMRGILRNQSY